jgi:hypothetical protein
MIDHPLFWILFVSVIFWSFFERFDAHRKEYVDHPRATFTYFIFSSAILIFVYPPVLSLYTSGILGFFIAILTVYLTYLLYLYLPKLFNGPKKKFPEDHHYFKLLDKKYILPKFAEIIFQQTFFGSILLLISDNFHLSISVLLLGALCFIVAHLPLFILQGKRVGIFYTAWAILGAPIFASILLSTGSLWYVIAFHMFFYTFLSGITWLFSPVKYSDSISNSI